MCIKVAKAMCEVISLVVSNQKKDFLLFFILSLFTDGGSGDVVLYLVFSS